MKSVAIFSATAACCIVQCFFANAGSLVPSLQLSVYFVLQNIDNYLYKENVPEMSESSICMWFKGVADDDERVNDWLFSTYNALGGGDDELALSWRGLTEGMNFAIEGSEYRLDITDPAIDVPSLWMGWNKHCFTWKMQGALKWYTDITESGVLELIGEVPIGAQKVNDGSRLVLFQELDNGGDFDLVQAAYGGLAWFNIWSREMNETELNSLGCKAKGDVVSMETLEIVGTISTWQESFPCLDGALPSLKQTDGHNLQAKMFCKIPGGSLSATYTISTEQVTTVNRCASLCSRHDRCLSATYQKDYQVCIMHNITDQQAGTKFDTNCGDGCIFLTTAECNV